MLSLKKFYARVRKEIPDEGIDYGHYSNRYYDAEDEDHVKHKVALEFGPGWEILEMDGPLPE